jgi:hypothetical protein
MNTSVIVKELKDLDQDFEWYPTTGGMIDCIKSDMIKYFNTNYNSKTEEHGHFLKSVSVLDCGAGDGRVVTDISNGGSKYAIEKSQILIKQMPDDVFIIGTEFFSSTLIDKEVQVIFCNPPYSEYIQWVEKIILEANCKMVYLILPQRWSDSNVIKSAIESREATFKIIGSDNFLDAERSARANIDIIAVKMFADHGQYSRDTPNTDPFDIWFETNFKPNSDKTKSSDYEKKQDRAKTLKEKLDGQLTAGRGLVPVLVELYNQEMEHLQKMFITICDLDYDILKELDVDTKNIKGALKQRIVGLKNKYWQELFNNYGKITSRLTHGSRELMLKKLTDHTSIDFTESNIYGVTVWVIKNANKYYDTQLIDLVENMIDKANVKLYKSNKRVFEDQDWRYCGRKPDGLSHYSLELRIVLHHIGGLNGGQAWNTYDYPNNLSKRAHNFLDDIMTISNNLGFSTPSWTDSRQESVYEWKSNKTNDFHMNKMKNEKLMSVKAFLNGNMHIKFNQDFIRTLNVEFGRLKGWLTNHVQASEELNIPVSKTEKFFKANYQLTQTSGLLQIGL